MGDPGPGSPRSQGTDGKRMWKFNRFLLNVVLCVVLVAFLLPLVRLLLAFVDIYLLEGLTR